MISKSELLDTLSNILKRIFDNHEKKNCASTDHIGIKNVDSQNFEEYIFDKFASKVQDISKLGVVEKIKRTYSNGKIYETHFYFDAKMYDLDENTIYLVKNIYGTQSPPDFTLFIHNYIPILIEAKSSKGKMPLWNCSLPNKRTIYIFYCGKMKRIFIHLSRHILDDEIEELLRNLHKKIKILTDEANKEIVERCNVDHLKKWDFYPRPMYNQKFEYEISKIDTYYHDVISELKDHLILENQEENIENELCKEIYQLSI